jgi:hypothetical protein
MYAGIPAHGKPLISPPHPLAVRYLSLMQNERITKTSGAAL